MSGVPFWHWRSLRLQTLAVVLIVALAPVLWVWSLGVEPQRLPVRLQLQQAAVAAVDGDLTAIARKSRARIRVLNPDLSVIADVDEDGDGPVEVVDRAFFGDQEPPTLEGFEAARAPLAQRDFLRTAPGGTPHTRCLTSEDLTLLVCEAALRTPDGRVVLVQRSTRRAFRALYEVRWGVLQLSLLVGVLALALGAWLVLRWIRPVRLLRDAALQRSAHPLAAPPIALARRDELGDLAGAFDDLLAAVRQQAAARESFLQDVAHEMKNPVAALRTTVDLLQQDLSAERATRIARILDSSTVRLQRTLDQLFELSRAEAGLPGDTFEALDLAALVRGAAEGIDHEGVQVVLDTEPFPVKGVPERLEAVIRNLLGNAIGFARSRVEVRVRPGVIEVRDDGPGISAEDQARVFDRFFTTRSDTTGTGVGLALVRAVVRAHGGEVSVHCPERGTVFTVRLPVAR